jgi:sulfite exporter TauE/SafE
MPMPSHLFEAFVLGLSMGPACLGYCAPVCVPLLACEQRSWKSTARILGLFLLGRLAGYSLIGVLVGAVGTLLLPNASAAFWGAIRILMGIMLVFFAWRLKAPETSWFKRTCGENTSRWFGASLGLLTGLNLCPPFGAAMAGAAATASIRQALFYFWAFFAGTAVYFAPLLFLSPFSRREPLRHIARVCLILAGTWLILEGAVAYL